MVPAPRPPVPVLVVLGPTAAGKSRLAAALADRFRSEIVSCDSVKVYRGMDIGSDKPSPEEIRRYKYHLVDIRSPSETMNAGDFLRLADAAVRDVAARGLLPIVEGGTALYLKSFLFGMFEGPGRDEALRRELLLRAEREGPETLHRELASVDPDRAAEILPRDLKRIVRALEIFRSTGRKPSELRREWKRSEPRPGFRFHLIGVTRPRPELYERIDRRIDDMLSAGLVEETAAILDSEGFSRTSGEAIGYRQVIAHLRGECSLEDAVRGIRRATRDLARRQESWFRKFPGVRWFRVSGEGLPVEEALQCVLSDDPGLERFLVPGARA